MAVAMKLTGIGGSATGTGGSNHGIVIETGGAVSATGLLELDGTGGPTNAGNRGVLVSGNLDANSMVIKGTGGGISNQEIVNYVKQHYDADFHTVVTAPRLGDPAELVAQVDRANEWLNWTAEYSDISTIIDSAYKWYTRV